MTHKQKIKVRNRKGEGRERIERSADREGNKCENWEGLGGRSDRDESPKTVGMEGTSKLTVPDIGEKRGPALRSDQTPNSISRSRSSLFAFLPPLALASLCAIRPNQTPHTIIHPIFLERSRENEGEKNVRERLVANNQNDPEARSRRSSIWESPD